jgi:hypothetical protein
LLPGVSAARWSWVVLWLWLLSIACFIVGFVFEFFPPLTHVLPFGAFALIVPAVVITFGLRVGSLTGLPHEKAETRAGYTTLRRKYPNLQQLDPKTGAVLRRAGEPYLPRSPFRRDRDDAHSAAVVPRPTILRRIAPSLIGTVLAIAFAVVVYWVTGILNRGLLTSLLVLALAAIVFYALAIGIGSIRVRRRLLRLQAASPGEFAFLFAPSNGFVSSLQAVVSLDSTPDPRLTRARAATASSTGIRFWQGEPPREVAALPWSRVISVQQDLVPFGRSSLPAVVIAFRDDEADEVVALPLMNAEANYLPLRSVAEVRWIVWELNQLRTSTTSARLI